MHAEIIALDHGHDQSAIAFLGKPYKAIKGRVKHFRLKTMWVAEKIVEGLTSLYYIKSKDNQADLFTKLLGKADVLRHTKVVLG